MKKIFLLVLILSLGLIGKAQWPIIQNLGSDSTLISVGRNFGGGIKGNLINTSYSDTTAANLQRIRQYAGGQIFTTGDTSLWLRSIGANKWVKLAGSAGATNIYNTSSTLTGNRTVSGNNLYNIAFDAVTTFRAEANAGTGKISSALVSTDSIFFQPNEGIFIIDSLPSGASTDSVLVWTQSSGRVKKRSYSSFTPTLQQTITRSTATNAFINAHYREVTDSVASTLLDQPLYQHNPLTAGSVWVNFTYSPELRLIAAVSHSGVGLDVMTSPDGIKWTLRTTPAQQWRGIAWSPKNKLFAAVAGTGTGNRVMTSPDGITWTNRTSAGDYKWRDIIWVDELGLFVAVGNTAGVTDKVMTSPDGITWTARTCPDREWSDIVWSVSLQKLLVTATSGIAGTGRIMTSTDGINWTLISDPVANEGDWEGVTYSEDLGLFCAVSFSSLASYSGKRVATSPDGVTWTARTTPGSVEWLSVAWSPSLGNFLAVGNAGNTMTSFDGITWRTRTTINRNWRRTYWIPELHSFGVIAYTFDTGATTDSLFYLSRPVDINQQYLALHNRNDTQTVRGQLRFPDLPTIGAGRVMTSDALGNASWSTAPSALTLPISSLTAATGSNTIDNGNLPQIWEWNTMTGTTGLRVQSSSTAISSSSSLFYVSRTGANAGASKTAVAGEFSSANTGTTSTNYGLSSTASNATTNYGISAIATNGTTSVAGRFQASGATNNYAIIVPASSGDVGIGTSAPTSKLHVVSTQTTGVGNQFSSSTTTTGTILDITGTSTALAAGNEGLNVNISGANATNGITATGARISVTNTNATSGTNNALDLTASGATTANNALNITAGAIALNGSAGTSGQVLTSAGANTLPTWTTPSSGLTVGTTTIASGTDTRALFQDGSVVGQDAGFTYNKTSDVLTVTNNIAFTGTGNGNAGNITWGTGYGSPALTLYDGGAGGRYGWGLRSNEMQFFNPTAAHYSWNKGGDFQVSGTNELMRLDCTTGNLGIGGSTPSAKLHIAAGTATASTAPLKLTTGTSLTTAEAGAFEYTTPQLFFTNGGAQRQEIPQIQQSRVSTQFDKTSSTTLGNITGLTATVVAGKTYRFGADLYTTSNVAGGVKVAIAGTATATAIVYEGLTTDAGLTTQSRGTALATAVGAVTAVTAAYIRITGTITVNAAGTLTVQFAQNASNGTASSVLVGSTFVITEML